MSQRPTLLIVDGHSMAFRAFFALPVENFATRTGQHTNGVFGFTSMLINVLRDEQPSHIAAAFDVSRQTFRKEKYPEYKEGRSATPDEFRGQIDITKEVLGALGITVLAEAGYEADDIIGSLATQAAIPVDVVTGDRDLFQLVDDATGVRVIYTGRGMSNLELLTDAVVVEKYKILPTQYADFAALRGDPSDGLPGVPGVGEKTAATLLAAHGDLAGIVAAAERGEGMSAGVRAKVLGAADYIAVAPKVVEVVRDLDLGAPDTRLTAPDPAAVEALAAAWSLGSSATRAAEAITARV
mgnify:CR=1 FL=1